MSAEIALRTPREGAALPAKIQYAKMLAESGLLPTSYRQQPANILYAIEYGDMLGLSPMAAITGIHVIEGKPTASAGLISALVRRAGHQLRVTGNDKQATCQIVRADDPSYTFEVTFTMADAAKANLVNKPVWRQYGPSMLKARAITQCARDACEEALFGLHYTPEELGAEVDEDGEIVAEVVAEAQPAGEPLRIEYGPGGTLAMDPECLDRETWLNDATEQASTLTDIEKLRGLFRQAKAQLDAGIITEDDAKHIQDLVTAQVEHLNTPVEGAVSAPDGDPWQAEIDSMTTREDAIPLLDKLDQQHKGGLLDSRRHKALKAAVRTKADGLPSAPGDGKGLDPADVLDGYTAQVAS